MSRNNWTDEKLFFRILNNKSERTYWDNIRVLFKRPTQEVFDTALKLTYSKDSREREVGLDVLSQLGSSQRPFYKESIIRFFELLETEHDNKVLLTVLFAIGKNNSKLSRLHIEKLCKLGNTKNSLIKRGLVSALCFVTAPNAIVTQIKLSSDKLNNIRDWATFSLGQMDRNNKKIRTALWARINDKHKNTKYEAIAGLAKRKDIRVKEVIRQELLSKEYGSLLFEAIIAYGDKVFLPPVTIAL